eukprot:COSAG01_NODE_959_length_12451_cov_18.389815_2_plen_82_part_00
MPQMTSAGGRGVDDTDGNGELDLDEFQVCLRKEFKGGNILGCHLIVVSCGSHGLRPIHSLVGRSRLGIRLPCALTWASRQR